jgi:hypothetical protein
MGTYINRNVLGYFIYTAKSQIEGRASAVKCLIKKISVGKLDLDAYHRSLRIMSKMGYLKAKEEGADVYYTITPKGIALYDSVAICLRQPSR